MKKLLFILFLFTFTFSFAQQTEKNSNVVSKTQQQVSISSISASPNPFSSETIIHFTSNKAQPVEFTVKNLLGKTVSKTTIDAIIGINTIPFKRNDLSKGMYVYSLQTDTEIISKRLVIR